MKGSCSVVAALFMLMAGSTQRAVPVQDNVKVLQEPATRSKIVQQGAEPGFGPPQHFDQTQRDEYADWAR